MHRYQTALSHLTSALEAMVDENDSLIVANIAHPIHLVENAIDRHRQALIAKKRGNDDSNALT